MEKLGVGIIGAGGISEAHGESFARLKDRVSVIAFSDVDLERASSRAEQFNAPIATNRYENLLKREDIHIISICSPPGDHFQQIVDSLSVGKHVLCEKPVVLNLAQLDKIETLVNQTGLCFGGAFQWRFGTGIQQLKDLHEHGLFGKIVYATNNLFWHRTQEYFDVPWRNTWNRSGGGIIFTLACHGLDALIYVLGDISTVIAEVAAMKYQIEIEDTGAAILRFKNGGFGAINATVTAHRQRSHLEIVGTDLEAISPDDPYGVAYQPWQFYSVDAHHEQRVKQFLASKNYQFEPASHRRLVEDFVNAVINKRQPAIHVAEIRRSLQVLTAIYKANRLGCKVELPIDSSDPFYSALNPD
ncbi:MAG: Gfo/Idh/MocA family oxidoreductase [candidate division KSB1 bacterium]|nr:Gfo/Idh/MocA family oxidoreductase [candidate division KSB1 bacterium]MDZ7336454.1 Gfo/Idh/MocA family oxidoreductase [candidate division KSB1 bacterium]MDZ7356270.1 Gfo/Idh/MocA family oxidoreductase [candidate division KSB1 bacterium]MDZ7377110.1 Gfo/Idh/MocA family oxidoreductase [candidate division KSB1 bacterium]MDZ7400075.1 Gfo/Idh/MocA family oxidoreductase [candidate division KSB1 bacterium]